MPENIDAPEGFTPGQPVEWRSGASIESGTYLGPDEFPMSSSWSRVEVDGEEHLVRTDVLRAEGVLAAEAAELADLAERAKGYPIGDDEHAARSRKHGFPWCDTCKRPSVYSEFFGLLHTTAEHPHGVPTDLDESGHEVTHREWFRVPAGVRGGSQS